jgi:hypothetical protein
MYAVQSTKQRQQIDPGDFQTGAKVEGDFHLGAPEHNPGVAHLPASRSTAACHDSYS